MNKIILSDQEVIFDIQDDFIEIKREIDSTCIMILIHGNTDLKIEQQSRKNFQIEFRIDPYVEINILDFKKNTDICMKSKYYLEQNSCLNVIKFYDCQDVIQEDIVYLNGINASVCYQLKTICTGKQDFSFQVYHHAAKTSSNIIHHGVNINEGTLSFDLTGVVPNKVKDCVLEQNSRIINLTENKCHIDPKLLIAENEVIANHSAMIGQFRDQELFYLQSRSIPYENALNLLIKGFLLDQIRDEDIIHTIDQYWR